MSDSVSPLATPFPDLPPIAGVRIAVARARYKEATAGEPAADR